MIFFGILLSMLGVLALGSQLENRRNAAVTPAANRLPASKNISFPVPLEIEAVPASQ